MKELLPEAAQVDQPVESRERSMSLVRFQRGNARHAAPIAVCTSLCIACRIYAQVSSLKRIGVGKSASNPVAGLASRQ
jgi:hypothetical protein